MALARRLAPVSELKKYAENKGAPAYYFWTADQFPENTNQRRYIEALNARRSSSFKAGRPTTPLRELGTFLYLVGKYTDPDSSLSPEEQAQRVWDDIGNPTGRPLVPMRYKCFTAFPGVPQGILEAAFLHVESRMLACKSNARGRRTSTWLGRWARAIEDELARRDRDGDLPPPEVRATLKMALLPDDMPARIVPARWGIWADPRR